MGSYRPSGSGNGGDRRRNAQLNRLTPTLPLILIKYHGNTSGASNCAITRCFACFSNGSKIYHFFHVLVNGFFLFSYLSSNN